MSSYIVIIIIQSTPRTPEQHDNHFILEQLDTHDSTTTTLVIQQWGILRMTKY